MTVTGSDSLLQYQLQPPMLYQVTWHILAQAARRPKKKTAPKILRCLDCGELISCISYNSSKLDKQVLWNRSCSYILQLLIQFIHPFVCLAPFNSSTKVVVRFKLFCFLEGCHDCNYWAWTNLHSFRFQRGRERERRLGVVVTDCKVLYRTFCRILCATSTLSGLCRGVRRMLERQWLQGDSALQCSEVQASWLQDFWKAWLVPRRITAKDNYIASVQSKEQTWNDVLNVLFLELCKLCECW